MNATALPLTRKKWAFILFLVTAVLSIQLCRIGRPYSGHFASYQANGLASIARNMLRENFREWYLPKTDLIVGGKKSLHLNAYPLPSVFAGLGIKVFGGTLEFWGRFPSILFNLFSILLVGRIAARWFHPRVGWAASAVYALSPYSLIYGQGFFFEPSATFLVLSSIWLLTDGLKKELPSGLVLLAGFLFSLAVTERIHFILLYPAFVLQLFLVREKKLLKILLFTLATFLTPIIWYGYTYFVSLRASNVHTNLFLQAATRVWQDKSLLFSFPYYLKLFDTISGVMLTPLVFPFLWLGFLGVKKEGRSFFFLLSYLIFGSLIVLLSPQKVVDQDFYLFSAFPFFAMVAGYGLSQTWVAWDLRRRTFATALFLALYLVISSRYFLHPIFKAHEKMDTIINAAESIRNHTAPEEFFVFAGREPTLLAYYADRPHWIMNLASVGAPLRPYHRVYRFSGNDPAEIEGLEAAMKDPVSWLDYFRKKGARYLAAAPRSELESAPALLHYLEEQGERISRDQDDFYLFRLKNPSEP